MEVKIQIPDNCELIKDGDTYIVKEKKQGPPRSWKEFCKCNPIKVGEAFIKRTEEDNQIVEASYFVGKERKDKCWCISKEEAESFLALMQLRQLRKAWVGDWMQPNSNGQIGFIAYSINRGKIIVDHGCVWRNSVPSFPTKEMAEDFLECFKDLCETAKMLL